MDREEGEEVGFALGGSVVSGGESSCVVVGTSSFVVSLSLMEGSGDEGLCCFLSSPDCAPFCVSG